MDTTASVVVGTDAQGWQEARQWAGAFLAGYASAQTRRSYCRDLDCWFAFCAAHQLHPFVGLRRTHLEVYLRELEAQPSPPTPGTLYRRISTLSSWFRWLEDEDLIVGNPAARVRRPHRYPRPQPWLKRNELTDLLAVAEDEGGDAYALVCLLGLNGLRVSEACNANITDLGGSRYQPTLRILGKGDKPAEVVLNPRTQQAVDQAVDGRRDRPAAAQPMAPAHATAQRRRHPAPTGVLSRGHGPGHTTRAAALLHHHRLLQGVPLHATRPPPHQGRHHRQLRPRVTTRTSG